MRVNDSVAIALIYVKINRQKLLTTHETGKEEFLKAFAFNVFWMKCVYKLLLLY